MKKAYVATGHHLIKKLAEADVIFPISKKELIDKAGKEVIKVDFDKSMSIEEYCSKITIEHFDNKEQFFCALNSTYLY